MFDVAGKKHGETFRTRDGRFSYTEFECIFDDWTTRRCIHVCSTRKTRHSMRTFLSSSRTELLAIGSFRLSYELKVSPSIERAGRRAYPSVARCLLPDIARSEEHVHWETRGEKGQSDLSLRRFVFQQSKEEDEEFITIVRFVFLLLI